MGENQPGGGGGGSDRLPVDFRTRPWTQPGHTYYGAQVADWGTGIDRNDRGGGDLGGGDRRRRGGGLTFG